MGTRSLTFVYTGKKPIINMYRQFDGYPSGHGKELYDFLKNKKIVNGLSGDLTNLCNGPECLAAQLVAYFKETAGGFYLYPITTKDCGQDYEYHIYVLDSNEENPFIKIKVTSYGKTKFSGTLTEFETWIKKEEK